MKPTHTVLDEERTKVSFDINAMSAIYHGDASRVEYFKKFQDAIAKDPILKFDPSQLGLNRIETVRNMCQKFLRYHQLFDFTKEETAGLAFSQFPDQMPGGQHVLMFMRSIKSMGTDDQIKKWIPPSESFKVFGCYAQTELGHGSDVQRLETTATYDKNTDEFIMHSPTLTSTKWWIGDLGLYANHALAAAQLVIDGKSYGMQYFIVPIRDMETHVPLKGIEVGDVGPKYGFNAKDNGFLRFDKVRIPRDNMLMRFHKVNKHGEFSNVGNEKIGYATMLHVRNAINQATVLTQAQGITIAVRYSLHRKQFKDERGQEVKILDYQLQLEKLLPILAGAYCNKFGSERINHFYDEVMTRINHDDFSLLKELHPLLAASKAMYTFDALFGIDKARLACGGHGYMDFSGLPPLLKEFSPNATYEGENTVLFLQTARYLVKNYAAGIQQKNLPEFTTYLRDPITTLQEKPDFLLEKKDYLYLDNLRRVLRYNAVYAVHRAVEKLQIGKQEMNLNDKDNWDQNAGIQLVKAAQAHFLLWNFNTSNEKIFGLRDEKIRDVLNKLLALYAISKLLEQPSSLFESGYFVDENFKQLRLSRDALLADLRKEAIGLVDAFCFHDNALKSAIGMYNADPYETLLDWVQNKNPLNRAGVHKELKHKFDQALLRESKL